MTTMAKNEALAPCEKEGGWVSKCEAPLEHQINPALGGGILVKIRSLSGVRSRGCLMSASQTFSPADLRPTASHEISV